MSDRRIPLLLGTAVLFGLAIGILLAVGLPRIIYTQRANSSFQNSQSLWLEKGSRSYTMVVYSNSLTQPTEGRNTLQVRDGIVVEANNPNCPNCTLDEFGSLTVEALFARIEAECLLDFPIQYCNVGYDRTLGYPRRIDTYPYHLDGRERPSITVESVVPVDVK